MKNKPTRHKETNTFKFQPFSERLANVDINVFHRVGHKNEAESDDEESTYLYQCLTKWNVLNLTDSYDDFRKELPNIQSLPLILNQKETIVSVILKHLELKNPLCIQPILEFVVALAQDLRHEICAFYPDIIQTLIGVLSTKDADILEWTFTCLAYLFKILWRYLVKDVKFVFETFIPLLMGNRPPYINNFAAESFAFIVRKVKDKEGFLKLILETLKEKPNCAFGCGRLLFEVLRGVTGQFHSCAESLLALYFKSLSNPDLPQQTLYDVLSHMVGAMCEGIKPQKNTVFWSVIQDTLQQFLSSWKTNPSDQTLNTLLLLFKLIQQVVHYKNCAFVSNSPSLVKLLVTMLGEARLPDDFLSVAFDIGANLLLSPQLQLSQEHASLITIKLLDLPKPHLLLDFMRKLLPYSGFDTLVLPHLLEYCRYLQEGVSDRNVLHILAQLVLYKSPPCATGIDLATWKPYPLDMDSCFSQTRRRAQKAAMFNLSDYITKLLSYPPDNIDRNVDAYLCAVICLPHVRPLSADTDLLRTVVRNLLSTLRPPAVGTGNCVDGGDKPSPDGKDCGTAERRTLRSTTRRKADCGEGGDASGGAAVASVDEKLARSESSVANGAGKLDTTTEKVGTEENYLFLLSAAIETAVHLTDRETLRKVCDLRDLLDVVLPLAEKGNVSALRSVDLYLTARTMDDMSLEEKEAVFKKLYSHLNGLLTSPFHKVRLLTVHIFSLFQDEPEGSDVATTTFRGSPFKVCLDAELVEPGVHTYRDKLAHLQHLEFDAAKFAQINLSELKQVPLRYLLSMLYVNFQLVWDPAIKLIASHARGMPIAEFWEIFSEQLRLATLQVNSDQQHSSVVPKVSNLKNRFLQDLYSSTHQLNDKPDFANYRILLWKAFSEFPEVCEVKNKDVTPLFLTFIQEEYFKYNTGEAKTWNVKQAGAKKSDGEAPMDVDAAENGEEQEVENVPADIAEPTAFGDCKLSGKNCSRTLIAQMSVFAKLRNPKALHREPELNKLYYHFLCHKNPEIQKLALNCLLTYKHKFLTPYQTNLFNLMNEKTFKTEITSFRIDKESTLIQEEHRENLLPIIMRIVYSKMLTKTGTRTSSKSSGQLGRSLVLRFLAGCHEDELLIFLEMAFRFYAKLMKDDPVDMVRSVMNGIDLEKVMNLKRLQSSLNLIGVVMNKFGSLMGGRLLPYVLRVLLCVASCVTGVLARRDSVRPGYIPTLRSLRALCVSTCANFFKSFEDYPWTSGEVDAVYEVFVWPWLDKLHVEGIYSPTALLKLFSCWSQNPRYFVLLAKHSEASSDLSPLPCVMKLLTGDKTHPSVTSLIMELVENLLTLQDHQAGGEEGDVKMCPPLEVTCVSSLDDAALAQLTINEDLNYGTKILLPHVSSVLSYLQRKMTSGRGGLRQRDFTVLSRISELVHDASLSATLLELFLPSVIKISATTSEETGEKMLETVANLVKNVAQPKNYIRPLAPLFGTISSTPSRKLLCNLIMTTVKIRSEEDSGLLVKNAEVLCEINAWDAKWVDQPDFNRRLDGFKKIHDMLAAGEVEVDIGISLIHNCFYLLKSEKDLALRDSTGYCLRKLAPALCQKYAKLAKERELLVNDTVLNLIRLGIRDKNEVVWHESVALLGEMARECKELHPVLRDLSSLSNKQDPEVDFFENILHLQLHRKERALHKFCEMAKQLPKAPNPQTLTQFILPLASMFLFSEKYINKHSIVSTAIEAVGVTCHLLPWHQYETVLRFYLGKLRDRDFQKQAIRIVVAILDAFHFNLARACVSKELVKKPVEEVEEEECAPADVDMAESGSAPLIEPEKQVDATEKNDEDPENPLNSTVAEEEQLPSFQRQTNLAPSTANRVIHTITVALLPQLHHVIAQRTTTDMQHKVNRKITSQDGEDDVLRIPVALAIVKLLQRLPEQIMEQHLPGVLLKLCMFLKSRLDSVRRTTRETLQQIMSTLGTPYLGTLLREMSSLLTKGFQVHVLIYSIHSVLVAMKPHFKPGDIDSCLQLVLEICKLDLFGAQSEEKDVNKITAKLFEAKSTKSFDTFHILAQNVTEKCLTDLILPLKEALMKYHSHKIVTKVSECLRQVVLGLSENAFVSPEDLVIFLYGVTSQSIPELIPESKKQQLSEEEREKQVRLKPTDTFLIPEAPRNRAGALTVKAKVSTQTGAHILVEFGTRLLHALLKKEKLKSEEYKKYLDPMVPVLEGCLKSQHVQLTVQTLQCLCWILKMNLPSMEEHVKGMAAEIFSILHKYAISGAYRGDNSELVAVAFKAVTVLVRDVHYHMVNQSQLKALLMYAEKYIHDYNRQAAAFGLLKAILARKMVVPEVAHVLKKVSLLSVTSEHDHIRLQARQVFHQFLMNYPLGDKLEQHLSFYLAQLNYPVQSGRESALEMLKTVINTFPLATLEEHCGVLFIPLGARLVNEQSQECKKMVAGCLRTMLQRVSKEERTRLFDIVMVWLQEIKVKHRQLAVQLCSLFVQEERESFEQRLSSLLPLLMQQFGNAFDDNRPGKFVRIAPAAEDENGVEAEEGKEKAKDHLLFQTFQTLLKICDNCPHFLRSSEWRDSVESFAENAELLLAHPHEWVRLGASMFLGFVFGSLDPKMVAAATRKDGGDFGYLSRKTLGKLRSLVLDFCALLHPGNVAPDLVKQVLKNLVFLAKVLKHLPERNLVEAEEKEEENGVSDNESDGEGGGEGEDGRKKGATKISLLWMVKRMRRVINIEIVETPKETTMQSAVFKWIGAVAVDLTKDELSPEILHHLLAPIVRETTIADESRAELLSVAKDVASIIKRKMGMEEYTRLVSKLQAQLNVKRAERKKQRTQEVVSEPQKAAKRKLKHHQKKKESKKRKIDFLKGRRKLEGKPKKHSVDR